MINKETLQPLPQDPPFTIKIELTEGCCLYCPFCGIHGIRKGPGDFKFLNPESARIIAEQIKATGWTSKIEFTMHGEPTMHPYAEEIITTFRTHLPNTQMMLTSNGGGLVKNRMRVKRLLDAGLNILALDDYEHANFVPKVLEYAESHGIPIYRYPQQTDVTPHTRVKPTDHIIVAIQDISTGKGGVGTRKLSNHCGCAAPLDHTLDKARCARPFRELVIRYDLAVPICCNDWRGEYYCGSLIWETIDEVWQGKWFDAARRYLFDRQRSFKPCYGCNSKSFRVGLLPDKLGKCTMPAPNVDTEKLIKEATSDSYTPMTAHVKRSWEVKTSFRDRLKKKDI